MGSDEFEDLPLCISCKWFIDGGTCKAFPKGIPDDFLTGELQHTIPYPGDNGIQYEPIK